MLCFTLQRGRRQNGERRKRGWNQLASPGWSLAALGWAQIIKGRVDEQKGVGGWGGLEWATRLGELGMEGVNLDREDANEERKSGRKVQEKWAEEMGSWSLDWNETLQWCCTDTKGWGVWEGGGGKLIIEKETGTAGSTRYQKRLLWSKEADN